MSLSPIPEPFKVDFTFAKALLNNSMFYKVSIRVIFANNNNTILFYLDPGVKVLKSICVEKKKKKQLVYIPAYSSFP